MGLPWANHHWDYHLIQFNWFIAPNHSSHFSNQSMDSQPVFVLAAEELRTLIHAANKPLTMCELDIIVANKKEWLYQQERLTQARRLTLCTTLNTLYQNKQIKLHGGQEITEPVKYSCMCPEHNKH